MTPRPATRWKSRLATAIGIVVSLMAVWQGVHGGQLGTYAAFVFLPMATEAVKSLNLLRSLGNRPLASDDSWKAFLVSLLGADIFVMLAALGAPMVASPLPFPSLRGYGVVLLVAFWALFLPTSLSLGRMLTVTPEATRLVTRGAYSVSRHPLYVLYGMLGVAFVLMGQTWLCVLALAVQAAMLAWRSRMEESVMDAAFPGEYAAYACRVGLLGPLGRRKAC